MSVLLFSFVLSAILLVGYRFLAPKLKLLDTPNERSHHKQTTIVGAGIAVAITVVSALMIAGSDTIAGLNSLSGFVGCTLVLALVGLVDDRCDLPSSPRLFVYFVVSALAIFLEAMSLPGWLQILAVFSLVWVINLVNFMDGLDGFVLTQTLCVASGLAILLFAPGGSPTLAFMALLLIAASLPLIWFNWPPASMFMGDSGSVFLGFYLGVLGLKCAFLDIRFGYAWLILMMPFLIDTTLTLLIRLKAGFAPHVAHRDHGYQRLVRRVGSTLPINFGLLLLQVCWQFPLAWWVVNDSYLSVFLVVFSAIPAVLLLTYLRRFD